MLLEAESRVVVACGPARPTQCDFSYVCKDGEQTSTTPSLESSIGICYVPSTGTTEEEDLEHNSVVPGYLLQRTDMHFVVVYAYWLLRTLVRWSKPSDLFLLNPMRIPALYVHRHDLSCVRTQVLFPHAPADVRTGALLFIIRKRKKHCFLFL